MSDKNFIITECDLDEIETFMEEKLSNFIIKLFGKETSENIDVKAEYIEYINEDMKCFKDEFRCELWLEVIFPQYSYLIKDHGVRNESVGMVLEFKGFQPFYINGKFESRNVFEWIQGMPIQKCEKIYGVCKDELYDRFNEYILDC